MHASQHAAASLVPHTDLKKIHNPPPASRGRRTTISLRASPFRCALRMSTKCRPFFLSADANDIQHFCAPIGVCWGELGRFALGRSLDLARNQSRSGVRPLFARTHFVGAIFVPAGISPLFSWMRLQTLIFPIASTSFATALITDSFSNSAPVVVSKHLLQSCALACTCSSVDRSSGTDLSGHVTASLAAASTFTARTNRSTSSSFCVWHLSRTFLQPVMPPWDCRLVFTRLCSWRVGAVLLGAHRSVLVGSFSITFAPLFTMLL